MITITAEAGEVRIVQDVSELPDLSGAKELFLDIESTSFDDDKDGFWPYNGDRVCGIAVTIDDEPWAYYIPYRHRNEKSPVPGNLPIEAVVEWIQTLPVDADWINHNVKFDAHFMRQDGYEHRGRMIDTVVLAKLINSDRFDFGLKILCREWLGMDMEDVDLIADYLKQLGKGNKKCRDYARVPIDMLGEYAGMDVLGNRELYRHLCWKRPEQSAQIWEIEIQLTPVLYDMECEGMYANRHQIMRETITTTERILEIHDRILELTGCEYTDSNPHLFDLLCNQCALPVIEYTKPDKDGNGGGNPSFNKDSLKAYSIHPSVTADPAIEELIQLIIEERRESHFKSLFLDTYLRLMTPEGCIHPSFNQLVRTGRMSCKQPNAQQLNKRAKNLILPPEGYDILRADASQIEFRIIAHYIQDEPTIQAYISDPWTDFHGFIAEQTHVGRPAGKTLNFSMGYGAGKKNVTNTLTGDPDIMREVGNLVNLLVEEGKLEESRRDSEYRRLCAMRAEDAYKSYHLRLPNLKKVTKKAASNCRERGYVYNAFGRRRHLPKKASHKAFNSVVQGGAMDYIKTRMNALSPRYNKKMRDWGIKPFVNVHDELAWFVPKGLLQRDPTVVPYIASMLAHQDVKFRIPFVWDMGFSEKNWNEASGDEIVLDADGKYLAGPLERIAV